MFVEGFRWKFIYVEKNLPEISYHFFMKSVLIRTFLLVVVVGFIAAVIVKYREPRFVAGEIAADFTATLADGSSVRLNDLRGKFVLLQFWGSWCGPCRRENPQLVELYWKYHDKGLEIFSIAIENGTTAGWQRAMQQDGMIWPYHAVQTERLGGPIAKLYNIHSIPTLYLINREGQIMGKNLSPQEIAKSLDTQFSAR